MDSLELILAFFVGVMFLMLFCFMFSLPFKIIEKLLLNTLIGIVIYILLHMFNLISLNIFGVVLVGASGGVGLIGIVLFSLFFI